jgi:hypothetical protein
VYPPRRGSILAMASLADQRRANRRSRPSYERSIAVTYGNQIQMIFTFLGYWDSSSLCGLNKDDAHASPVSTEVVPHL